VEEEVRMCDRGEGCVRVIREDEEDELREKAKPK
jgi:hypothetical protein